MTETVTITGKDLKQLVEMRFWGIKNALKGLVENVELELDENGNDKHFIQIYDFTTSFTTITCHETGYHFHWGSSTPVEIKTIVEDIMDGE
ncbi:hypothetical protein [Priestia aryabhattai]|uniref:hypothetical protein n=1 Tax=Priestia aryabhattai TaxID=412384 RepID=UPI002E1C8092|nr:hypothetical protein [Priestia aryabhattai]